MDAEKAEFKRLVDLVGWSQTEAARRLYKTPSAINHLLNPGHPNKPTQTMMQLLKLIIASEHPDLLNLRTFDLDHSLDGAKNDILHLSPRERELIKNLRQLPKAELERVQTVIDALLQPLVFKTRKRRK